MTPRRGRAAGFQITSVGDGDAARPRAASGSWCTRSCTLPRTTSPDSASTLVRRDSTARATSSAAQPAMASRSEEHTSELQSRLHLVCRLLLEKKKPPLLKRMVLAGMNDPKSGKCLSHYS